MSRPRPLLWWGVAVVGALALGLVAGLGQRWLGPVPGAVLTGLACAAGFVLSLGKWRQLDEAAREAHKSAWFWGGCGALVVIGAALTWLMRAGATVDLGHWALGHSTGALVATGIVFCLAAQLVGYGLVWAGWWLSKR